jgi:hypothetical protein
MKERHATDLYAPLTKDEREALADRRPGPEPKPPSELNGTLVKTYLPPDLATHLRAVARKRGMSVSALVRQHIEKGLGL